MYVYEINIYNSYLKEIQIKNHLIIILLKIKTFPWINYTEGTILDKAYKFKKNLNIYCIQIINHISNFAKMVIK